MVVPLAVSQSSSGVFPGPIQEKVPDVCPASDQRPLDIAGIAGTIPEAKTEKTYEFMPGRIAELDGLRGIAILLVILYHYFHPLIMRGNSLIGDFSRMLLGYGWSGVDLFFVLSGFLVGGILIDRRKSKNLFSTFFGKRCMRILPLYLIFLAIASLFVYCDADAACSLPVARYLLFVQNFDMAVAGEKFHGLLSHTWSLAVEEQFYFLLPVLIAFLPARRIPALCATMVFFAPLFRFFLHFNGWSPLALYVLLPCRMDSLFAGVLIAYGCRKKGFLERVGRMRAFLWSLFVVLLAGVLYSAFVTDTASPGSVVNCLVGFSWITVLWSTLMLLTLTAKNTVLQKILSNGMLRMLGVMAYSLYLFHYLINIICRVMLQHDTSTMSGCSDVFVAVVSIGVSVGFAHFTYRYIEAPFLNLGRRFRYAQAG